ncbi:MAG TPA: hypothetical protein VN175_08120, partial [Rhizomicrobium sp.]|nr:hypothetical protein [Rhizomicrobium sp.]
MAVLTGTGLGNGQIQAVFGSPFLFTGGGDTGFTASNSYGTVSVTGTGLTYSSSVLNGQTVYQLTGGTITGVSYTNGPNSQTWSNISVSAAAAFNAILNFNAFNSLFFNGDDVFTWNAANVSGNAPFLYGYGGNDTFYIGDWDKSRGQYRIDGGSGDDTLYVTGGVGNSPYASFPPSSGLFTSQLEPLFIVSNVEIIKLGAGYDYTLLVRSDLVTSGNTTVVDATALGAPNRLIFDTNTFYNGQAITGDLVLLGGAGDDVLQGGTGTNTFNGGGGNDTVTFSWGQSSVSHPTGVTANLSLTGLQNFGTNWGTGTFISIENLVGSGWDDTLIGDSGDNLLTGGGGNDTLDGGAGYDTAIYSSAKSNYTISYSGHTVTIAGPDGTDTLTNVEFARFSDQTVQIGGPVVASASTRVAANQTITLSNLASISDLTGYAITAYQLWDSTSDPNSGHFVINGQVQAAGTIINVTAAQLAQTSFVTGTANDNLQIRALDANNIWSATDNVAWSPFSIGPTVNNLPVLTTHAPVYPNHFQTFSLSSLLSVTDADNDTMTRYQLWDGSRDPNSGHFVVNGQVMAAGTIIDITAAQAAQTSYVTGYLSDNLQIRAYDGFDWSAADNAAWAPFTVTVFENPPTVVTSDRTTWQAGQTVAATYLLNVSDTDQDPLTRFQFWDATRDPNSGYFVVNGQVQAAGTIIDLTPAQFAQTSFVVGSVADNIQVRVSDGYAWSASDTQAWAPFKVAPAPNHPPSVSTYYQGVTATRNQVMNWAQLTVQVID